MSTGAPCMVRCWRHYRSIGKTTRATCKTMSYRCRNLSVRSHFLRVLHKPTQRPRADMTRDFFDEPAYLSIVRPDEQKFLSLPDCTAIFGKQHVVKDGPCTGIKFVSFLRPADGFNHESFLGYWRSNHAPLVEEVEPFWKHIRRYVQNHGIPELYRGLSAEGRPAPFFRCRRNLVRFGGEPRGGFQ